MNRRRHYKRTGRLLVACSARDSTTCRSDDSSVILSFFGVYGWFLHYCSCSNAWLAYSITAPAHPQANSVAVYTALFFEEISDAGKDYIAI